LEVLAGRMHIMLGETRLQFGQIGESLRQTDEMTSNLRQQLDLPAAASAPPESALPLASEKPPGLRNWR
jgi:hypothetical protein